MLPAEGAPLVPTIVPPIVTRVAPAGAGLAWWASGWRLFTRSIAMWFGIVLVYVALSVLMSKVPFIGGAAEWLLTPVFLGGIMLGFDALQRGQPVRFAHLFDGFKQQHFVSLLLVGVFNIVLTVAAILFGVVAIASGIDLSGSLSIGSLAADPLQMLRAFGLVSFLAIALGLLVLAVIAMANWFAPSLIVLRNARPLEAMLTSFRACMRNWAPFLVYGVIGIGISVAASLAFVVLTGLLGFSTVLALLDGTASWSSIGVELMSLGAVYVAFLIVIAVVVSGSTYAGYRDTLAADDAPPVPVAGF